MRGWERRSPGRKGSRLDKQAGAGRGRPDGQSERPPSMRGAEKAGESRAWREQPEPGGQGQRRPAGRSGRTPWGQAGRQPNRTCLCRPRTSLGADGGRPVGDRVGCCLAEQSGERRTFSPVKSSIPNTVKRHRWTASSSPTLGEVGRSALSASRRGPGSTDPAQPGAPCPLAGDARPERACPRRDSSKDPGTRRGERPLRQPGPAVRGQPRESWGWGCGERVGGQGRREVSSRSQGRKHMQDGAGGRGQGKAVRGLP